MIGSILATESAHFFAQESEQYKNQTAITGTCVEAGMYWRKSVLRGEEII